MSTEGTLHVSITVTFQCSVILELQKDVTVC